jgi:hypothetical protein
MPVVVAAEDAESIAIIDQTGALLAAMARQSDLFWTATIDGSQISEGHLQMQAVAEGLDGTETRSAVVSVPILASNGLQLELRIVEATTTVVYDRPWSTEPGELGRIPSPGEGVSVTPPAIATVSAHEVAVLDPAASRITCFDESGTPTCSVPLPLDASGDLFAIGDGTLIATDIRRTEGKQEATVIQIDPRAATAEVVFHEYPLSIPGFAGVAGNTQFTWDAASRTAWVGLPELATPRTGPPDPDLFPYVDALHFGDPVTLGLTIQRQMLRPHLAPGDVSLLDGNAWVRLYQGDQPGFAVIGLETTISGVIWMVTETTDADGALRTDLVRWHPGQLTADVYSFDYLVSENQTRLMTVLDDTSVAFLDRNIGGRIRIFTLP